MTQSTKSLFALDNSASLLPARTPVIFVLGADDMEIVCTKELLQRNGSPFVQPATTKVEGAAYNTACLPAGDKSRTVAFLGCTHAPDRAWRDTVPLQLGSILEAASLLKLKMEAVQWRWLHLIVANKGGIPSLLAAGATKEEIALVRQLERTLLGVTPEEEVTAEGAISSMEKEPDGTFRIIRLPHGRVETVTDRLYSECRTLDVLILCADGTIQFHGHQAICLALERRFQGWSKTTAFDCEEPGQDRWGGAWGVIPTPEQAAPPGASVVTFIRARLAASIAETQQVWQQTKAVQSEVRAQRPTDY